ncbi:uncharacterized protein [Rutidosis leptorrhynchoides]|uniref:uncharacterized protein n=1 Tax=Rutidosis leptorrhynchoides TaxID=125765 RepID=UPI003A99BE0B
MCPCEESCSNQQFQKRKFSKLKCVPSGKKGLGLQLMEDIPKGRFVIEYVGEVLDIRSYEARQKEYASKGHKHFYFMTLNGNEVIDACAKGNLGRFINHSCEPNCCTEKGEEPTFDYNYVRVFGAVAKNCVCGSSKCRGVISVDPLNDETVVLGDSDDEYPEHVTLYDNTSNKLDPIISGTQTSERTSLVSDLPDVDEKNEDVTTTTDSIEMEVSTERSSLESKIEFREEILAHDVSFEGDNVNNEISSRDALNDSVVEGDLKQSMKKPKSNTNCNKCTVLKSKSRSKLPSLSSALKKGKLKSTQPEIDRKPLVEPQKPKRLVVDNLTGRFGAGCFKGVSDTSMFNCL